jgi:transcriptional regulator with PAS, ATPase and Fis domain
MSADRPRPFRWQALLQRAGEAVFVLDRRRRLLFVNAAWVQLTGMSAERAHGMLCRRPRPVGAEGLLEDILAHILTPPQEVIRGSFARARRLFPDRPRSGEGVVSPTVPRWWDVEFLPLRQDGPGDGYLIIGRVVPLRHEGPQTPVLLPERLMDLRQRWMARFGFELLSSCVPAMHRVLGQARLACSVRAPVLLTGESGTGKETIARIIHYQSVVRERSFVALDCRRLPVPMVSALLFAEPCAALEAPGAIYIDEPAQLPRDVQLRLCEWLARRATLGEADKAPRLFAGCTRPEEYIAAGQLLTELFCLLGMLTITVPPLRERPSDLPRLVEKTLSELNNERERTVSALTPEAWEVMRHHHWPGNLEELQEVLSDAHARSTTERIDVTDLPAALCQAQRLDLDALRAAIRPVPLEETLKEVEKRLIHLALKRARGNRGQAADLLGIYRARLLRRMESLGMEDNSGGE